MNINNKPLIVVENLCKGFEDGEVLKNVSFTIREGTWHDHRRAAVDLAPPELS